MDLVYAASVVISRAGASSVSELYCWETSDFYPFAQCCGGSSNEERKIDSRQERGSATEGIN
jgi:hypothetical protein